MENASRWVAIGILVYIGVVLTSINSKMGYLDLQSTEVAVLNEVKTQSFSGNELSETKRAFSPAGLDYNYTIAVLIITAITSVVLTWHLSRLYHNQKWSKKILSKSFSHRREPVVNFRQREPLHEDQDAIFEKPLPDGRITDSWLPPKAQKLYESWGRGES
ncbi:MAG: hypothetical protein KTR19_03860 [Hyphomicrobiales bacterium]|nr:hypothetical protein [Hyphomicrobiales bacterium]